MASQLFAAPRAKWKRRSPRVGALPTCRPRPRRGKRLRVAGRAAAVVAAGVSAGSDGGSSDEPNIPSPAAAPPSAPPAVSALDAVAAARADSSTAATYAVNAGVVAHALGGGAAAGEHERHVAVVEIAPAPSENDATAAWQRRPPQPHHRQQQHARAPARCACLQPWRTTRMYAPVVLSRTRCRPGRPTAALASSVPPWLSRKKRRDDGGVTYWHVAPHSTLNTKRGLLHALCAPSRRITWKNTTLWPALACCRRGGGSVNVSRRPLRLRAQRFALPAGTRQPLVHSTRQPHLLQLLRRGMRTAGKPMLQRRSRHLGVARA
eukprot:350579-Chlamydomonas_euryale.AAC.3